MNIKKCGTHGYYRGNKCECGEEGEKVLSENKTRSLGKIVSGALRHFPKDIGINLDENGWTSLDELYEAIKTRNKYDWLEKDHLRVLVETDEKGRYEIENGKIRATYGHTVDVRPDLPSKKVEGKLYFGSSKEEAGRIVEIGLKPAEKTRVHLSESKKSALEVAMSSTDNPVLIEVHAESAQEDGIEILKAAKELWVADEIPPEYLEIAST
ncbi:MAG: RNA:NAD 2'-phosphotransferase KptA [Candidatus Methanohalarchaeum thermophilum]|uniref:Probable RNA 2'-phosphotransferase n=1 Tax=Methanohalarchaeum thermophilum TaxID=1903181 RepID=A0A1Q6DTF4_METT1|nr:MAG: RNA:NAD 2'-phosphotransferase KptA [Candidatus Methanohalarchaeum thermophilum]